MEIRGKVYRANSLLPWLLGSNASPASLWDYSFRYILLHVKSPAQNSNELSRLNRSLTVFKCHAVIGEINLLVLGYKSIQEAEEMFWVHHWCFYFFLFCVVPNVVKNSTIPLRWLQLLTLYLFSFSKILSYSKLPRQCHRKSFVIFRRSAPVGFPVVLLEAWLGRTSGMGSQPPSLGEGWSSPWVLKLPRHEPLIVLLRHFSS